MKPRTILIRFFEVKIASKLGQVLRRIQIKGDEVHARHQAFSWFATLFVLGFTDLACRHPTQESQKAVVQITRPQIEKSAKDTDITVAPAGQLVEPTAEVQPPTSTEMNASKDAVQSPKKKVAGRDTAGSEPGTSEGKVVPSSLPTQSTDVVKDPKTVRRSVEPPASQAVLVQIARSDSHPVAPVPTGDKEAKAVTPTAKAIQPAKGSEALHTIANNPANQTALAQVALTDKDWSVRKTAVEGLTNQGVLAQVAGSDEDVDIRKLAVSRLTVQATLAKVATSDKDWNVRKAATAMLTQQGVLARIAQVDVDLDIRKLAVSLLTDQAALARIATSDKDWSVRKSAVNKLTGRRSLTQVATSDNDPDIRKLAVSRLIDQTSTPETDPDN